MLLDGNVLAPISRNMKQMNALLKSEQTELDNFEQEVAIQTDQLFIGCTDREIRRYERIFDIKNTSGGIEQRRNRIIAKLNTRSPATLKSVEHIISVITGKPCKIYEHYGRYLIEVKYEFTGDYVALQGDMRDALDEIKPAHINYTMLATYPLSTHLHIGAHTRIAQHVTVRPYMPPPMELQTKVAAAAWTKVGQHIRILSKEMD